MTEVSNLTRLSGLTLQNKGYVAFLKAVHEAFPTAAIDQELLLAKHTERIYDEGGVRVSRKLKKSKTLSTNVLVAARQSFLQNTINRGRAILPPKLPDGTINTTEC